MQNYPYVKKKAFKNLGAPKNTILNWKKNKKNLFQKLQKTSHCDEYKKVDKARYDWFILQRN